MAQSPTGLRARLQTLYFGDSRLATRFRFALIVFDITVIALFLVVSFFDAARWIMWVDLLFAGLILLEFLARTYAETDRRKHLLSLASLADIVVIVSLVASAFIENLAFLRVARALRLMRSYHVLRDIRGRSPWFRLHEDIINRTVNLGVFIFIVTSAVYVSQHRVNAGIQTYVDALYFTITTLTTTGFGDVVLKGDIGRILAVLVMVVGVSLFLRLLQALFKPSKVRFECPDCALLIHDIDAVHCKHCGRVLAIQNEGFD